MNLFYNKKSLKDTLLIALNNNVVDLVENYENFTILYSKKEPVAINIFNVSNYIDLQEGYLFPNKEICEFVLKVTNINLLDYINPTLMIVKIEECENIPNTHLHKCLVDLGDKKIQIVCGAKNAKKDLITVCACENTFLPNGMYISSGELMGIKSYGMLCSYKELGLSEISNGIIELDEHLDIGKPFLKVYANEC